MRLSRLLLAAVLVAASSLIAGACGERPTPSTPDAGTTPDGGAPPDGGVVLGGCQVLTVGAPKLDNQDDVQTNYSLPVTTPVESAVPDYLVLQFLNRGERVENATGTFPLGADINANFGTCAECVLVFADQSGPQLPPLKTFFATEGSITLERDPRTQTLKGRLTGTRLREVTIDEGTLESALVPGGACLELPEITFDYKFVPAAWTCAPERYKAGDACDCGCGVEDPDCFLDDGSVNTEVRGCEAGDACVLGACLEGCNPFDASVTEACGAGVCSVGHPNDYCVADASLVDSAKLGEKCSGEATTICAVEGDVGRGLCDAEDRQCRPVCGKDADCTGQDEICYRTVPFLGGPEGKGYCRPRVPSSWTCDPAWYEDGAFCDCLCGAYDHHDCIDPSHPVRGCPEGKMCFVDFCE